MTAQKITEGMGRMGIFYELFQDHRPDLMMWLTTHIRPHTAIVGPRVTLEIESPLALSIQRIITQ
jgi:hypothetical protein